MPPVNLAEAFVTVATVRKVRSMPLLPGNARSVKISPGPIDAYRLASALAGVLSARQFAQLLLGLIALRTAWSSAATESLVLRLVDRNELGRTELSSDEALEELGNGGLTLAMLTNLDLSTRSGAGRAVLSPIQVSFRDALAMSVARIDVIGRLGHDNDGDTKMYEAARKSVASALRPLSGYIFNLNKSHDGDAAVLARARCEREGPALLAQAFGKNEQELDTLISAAMAKKVHSVGFQKVLEQELGYTLALATWAQAYRVRREGERSRIDTIRRASARHGSVGQDLHDIEYGQAPRIHTSVRQNLMAQGHLDRLSPLQMVHLSLLFGLEPAHEVFLSRQYLLPILAAGAFVGRIAMRRQNTLIADPVTACGLTALIEMTDPAFARPAEPPHRDPAIILLQNTIISQIAAAGYPLRAFEEAAKRYLKTGEPTEVVAQDGTFSFVAG
jgi:hypothetical protein